MSTFEQDCAEVLGSNPGLATFDESEEINPDSGESKMCSLISILNVLALNKLTNMRSVSLQRVLKIEYRPLNCVHPFQGDP